MSIVRPIADLAIGAAGERRRRLLPILGVEFGTYFCSKSDSLRTWNLRNSNLLLQQHVEALSVLPLPVLPEAVKVRLFAAEVAAFRARSAQV